MFASLMAIKEEKGEKEPKVDAEPTAEAPAAAADDESKTAPGEAKPPPRPSEDELKEKIEELNTKINTLQARASKVKETLDARESGKGETPEVQKSKALMNSSKTEARRLAQERRNIYDQINAAEAQKKHQQELAQRLKSQLTYFSVDEVDRKIKALEHQQQTTSMAVKDEKKILEEIKKLSANKPMIRQYDEARESLKGVSEHHATLYAQLKAKAAELEVVKEQEDKYKAELDAAKAKEEAKKTDIPGLFKERDAIRKEMSDHRDAIKKLRDDFNEKRKEWEKYQKIVRDQKKKEWEERQAARKAEYEEQKRLYDEEEAKRDPWEEEKIICEQLIVYCAKYVPKEEAKKEEPKEMVLEKGAKVVKKAELEDDWGGLMKKKSKSKGGAGLDPAAPKTVAPKTVTLKHSPTDLSLWLKLELGAPADSSECPALHEKLLEKREWLKTAPPKPKPKKAEKPKEEEKAKEEDASKGVETDAPTAPPAAPAAPAAPAEEPAFDLKALKEQEAAEMKKKIEENALKAKQKEKEEDERIAKMQALEAQGVKVAGGMHKFDASEVDVHGGNATADDFLDAFGM